MGKYRMYEPYGYAENNDYMGKITQLDNELATNRNNDSKEFASVEYSQTLKSFLFKNVKGEVVGKAEMKDIIPQDLIEDARYDVETKSIIIKFTNGQEISIPLDDIIDIAEAGDGLQLSDNKFSIMLNQDCEEFLTVDADGLKLSGVQDAINVERDRAISAETAENERATNAENDIVNALDLETSERKSEDNRVLDDVLTRIWSNKVHNSGATGYFQTKASNGNSYAQLWNENSGGGALYYNNPANIISFVGVNSDNADGICVQIYSKNKASNIGTRLNVNPNGMYYTTRKADGTFTANDELITKKEQNELQAEIDTLENALTTLNGTVTSLSNTLTTINNNISAINAEISSLKARVTALENRI